ncbi:hypothetical protein B0H19DRAFT_1328150 [Mycena capillaripes]|nr:hypothetical protein B0H19DRAFT_1328150 [Mycena capillaripes]
MAVTVRTRKDYGRIRQKRFIRVYTTDEHQQTLRESFERASAKTIGPWMLSGWLRAISHSKRLNGWSYVACSAGMRPPCSAEDAIAVDDEEEEDSTAPMPLGIKAAVRKLQKIIRAVRSSLQRRQQWYSILSPGSIVAGMHMLIFDVRTRWPSTHQMMSTLSTYKFASVTDPRYYVYPTYDYLTEFFSYY